MRRKLTKKEKRRRYQEVDYYTINSALGIEWANWFILIGGRERGKTFTVQDYVLHEYFFGKKLKGVPFYWMRLNDIALLSMKLNNGAKMFEPLLVAKYSLLREMKVRGDTVFVPTKKGGKATKPLCYLFSLSTAYNQKGSALFDKNTFKGANLIVDEMAREKGQRRTFDIAYNLKMQIENTVRSERENVKVFMMLNNTEDCPEALSLFGFIPVEFGRYKLKRKHCFIDYIPNTEAYNKRRKKALANEIDNGTGNFTNVIERDIMSLYKGRLDKPMSVVKFTKDPLDWFTLWTTQNKKVTVVKRYCNEKLPVVAMRRYLDEEFYTEMRDNIIALEDARSLFYSDILTQQLWRKNLEIIKK